jgi:hypothetical protein
MYRFGDLSGSAASRLWCLQTKPEGLPSNKGMFFIYQFTFPQESPDDGPSGQKHTNYDLKICDDGMLIQLLTLWTLSSLLFFNDVSEIGHCLHPQVEAYSVRPNR